MNDRATQSKSTFARLLNQVERLGNRVPHPSILFFALIVVVVLISHVFAMLGTRVEHQQIDPVSHETLTVTTTVKSLISSEGIRFIFTSVVDNFVNFGPVGIILVAMIGVGLAERAGLIQAMIRQAVASAPRKTMTAIIVTLGVVSSIASDAGYLVLIPLGAAAFASLGRHPLAGLAAAFAGVAAAFGVNFFVKPIDGILIEMTNDAIKLVDASQSIEMAANFYFGVASSVLLIVVCTLVTDWLVEPRLGVYQEATPSADTGRLSSDESRGLKYALVGFLATVVVLGLLSFPSSAPLRNPETNDLFGQSPFMSSLVVLIMILFLVSGVAYGVGARTIRSAQDAINAIIRTFADLAELLFLFFVISQFVAYFNFSNMGTVLAIALANLLTEASLGTNALLLGFIFIGFALCFPLPNILPKWAVMAPIFVPLFMKLGVAPDVVLAAYRVSDSPPNVINPLLPHFALIVGFAQRYVKDAGVGTIVALMLPYTLITAVTWILGFFAWYLLGLPFGPR